MDVTITRESLLKVLQMVVGAVERKQTLPILSNVLLQATTHQLCITATDTEIELIARAAFAEPATVGKTTLPARKIIDICKTLPENAIVRIYTQENQQVIVKAGRSRFVLSTLPVDDFPQSEEDPGQFEFTFREAQLRYLIESTYFSMAQNDVRYYLNGMLLQISPEDICAAATDGHRLAFVRVDNEQKVGDCKILIPRKGAIELHRLLQEQDSTITMTVTDNHVRINTDAFTLTSKLLEGQFPDFERAIPKGEGNEIVIDRDVLKQALSRAAILSGEELKDVRIQLRTNLLRILANNPEQEEAEEELEVLYTGEDIEVDFNANYILDVLASFPKGDAVLTIKDSHSSLLLNSALDENRDYVVMPMRG